MATKFLSKTDFNNLKEEIKMTELGRMIYEDGVVEGIERGIEQGIEQEATDNAKNLFTNGVTYDIVRSSIKNLTDESLQKIYDEVVGNKNV